MRIWTIGHSTRPLDEFIAVLREYGITRVADVRSIPRSRHVPQYNLDSLSRTLPEAGIEYVHLKELGGLRRARKDSPNAGWRNARFRGYADYMQTPGFVAGLARLEELAAQKPTVIMCAEAVPWRCHRSLISDALLVRGWEVGEIMPDGKVREHPLTAFAQVVDDHIYYPKSQDAAAPDTLW